jgi:hypothetical protein
LYTTNLHQHEISSLMVKDDPYIESGKIVAIPLTGYPLNFNSIYGGGFLKWWKSVQISKKVFRICGEIAYECQGCRFEENILSKKCNANTTMVVKGCVSVINRNVSSLTLQYS